MKLKMICKNPACGLSFETEDKRQKYCCIQCAYADRPSNKAVVQCNYCNSDIYIFPSRLDGRKHFCNVDCANEYQKLHGKGPNNPQWRGKSLAKVCPYCKRTFRKGQNRFCSNRCSMGALNETLKEDKHPSWRGGTTKGRRKTEGTVKYRNWRMSVFRRDDFRCAMCSTNKDICVHHILPFADYPKLRTKLDNGVTLCQYHHRLIRGQEYIYVHYFKRYLYLLDQRAVAYAKSIQN